MRYTPSSAFETFPWPAAGETQMGAIGELARSLVTRRAGICTTSAVGLTDVYNQLEDGAWTELGELHRRLDRAVLVAYGWTDLDPADSVTINHRLYELNRRIRAGDLEYFGPALDR
jgi:hypothetical protein